MVSITNFIGIVAGVFGLVTGTVSLLYQRRQTLIMAAQVDKELEIKITRDLDAPDGAIDSKLRTFLNRRLSEMRVGMRQEFGQRLDEIMHILEDSHLAERKDIAIEVVRLLSDQKDAVEGFKESNSKVSTLEQEIRILQQAIEDIRNGVGNQVMVRAQIRGIAEQLLRMTGQESPGHTKVAPALTLEGADMVEPASDNHS